MHPVAALRSIYGGQKYRSKRFTEARASESTLFEVSLNLNFFQDYDRIGWNAIASRSFFPASGTIMIGDADIIKQITHNHPGFPKPTELYGGLSRFGNVSDTSFITIVILTQILQNIVTTEGDEWRKHRRIAAPAFSEVVPACYKVEMFTFSAEKQSPRLGHDRNCSDRPHRGYMGSTERSKHRAIP